MVIRGRVTLPLFAFAPPSQHRNRQPTSPAIISKGDRAAENEQEDSERKEKTAEQVCADHATLSESLPPSLRLRCYDASSSPTAVGTRLRLQRCTSSPLPTLVAASPVPLQSQSLPCYSMDSLSN